MIRGLCWSLFAWMALSTLAVAQVRLEFGSQTATYRSVLQLRNGNRLMVGSAPSGPNGRLQPALTTLGTQTGTVAAFGGSGNTAPQAAALDPNGNVWIVGYTDSNDFSLVNPIFTQKGSYGAAGFVVEFDAAANKLLFATFMGGYTTAIAIDSGGNVYVGGQGTTTIYPDGSTSISSFLAKISPAGKLVYATALASGGGCTGSGSGCIGHQSTSAGVDGLAVDANGAVTIGGWLGGIFYAQYQKRLPGDGYICRIAPDGSKLLWKATYPKASKVFVALDTAGNVGLFGRYETLTLSSYPVLGPPVLFAAQLKADGSGFNYKKDLGQFVDANAAGMLVDSRGNMYLAGTNSSPDFPQTAPVPNLGSDFVVKIDPSGAPIQPTLRLPHGAIGAPPSFNTYGDLMLPGSNGSLLTVPNDYIGLGPPVIVAFANAASYALNTGIFPGALLTLFGFNLPSLAEGLQVQIAGHPAPILYAGPNQINLQVPFDLPSSEAWFPIALSPGDVSIQVSASQSLGIFTIDGVHAAALNQDGSVNSESNPALADSVVSLFGTAEFWPPGMTNGAVSSAPLPLDPDLNKLEVESNLARLAILYAGAAPGIINGVFQINAKLPAVRPWTHAITLRSTLPSGTISSNAVQVYIK